jgi:hypothetical protein
MNNIPEVIKKQIDDLFDGLEIGGDEYNIIFHKNGKPIFVHFENFMGSSDVAFLRDIGNIIFYGIELMPSVKDYIYNKVHELLVDVGMPSDEEFDLYVLSPTRDKEYRELFYDMMNEE